MESSCFNALSPEYVPQHIAISVNMEEQSTCSPIPCAICVLREPFCDKYGSVRRAVSGTMRCLDHMGQCAACMSSVISDTHLCCRRCWSANRLQTLIDMNLEILKKEPNRFCLYQTSTITQQEMWSCGCVTCVDKMTSFYVQRALEEGEGRSLTSPSISDSDSVGFDILKNID